MKSWVILTQRHEQIAILTLPSHDSLKHKRVHRTILETSISYSFDHWFFFFFPLSITSHLTLILIILFHVDKL